MRRYRRFIIIKINAPGIAYGVIDGKSITFYGQNGEVAKVIDLSMMLEEIIDIPMYFKCLFEKGMDAIGCVAETESMDLEEYYQTQNPFISFTQGLVRTPEPELLRVFDLDDNGMCLAIQIVPHVNDIYYNFTIATYHRLIMDIIVNPVDMLYVDATNGYVHTMERGHNEKSFNPTEIMAFLHPELTSDTKEDAPKRAFYL